MLLKWGDRPRFSLSPLLFGLVLGLCVGKWWFLPSSPAVHTIHDPKITCLILHRGPSYKNINASREGFLKKCANYLIVKPMKAYTHKDEKCEVPEGVIVVSADSGWGVLCRAFHLLPLPIEWLIIVPDSSFVVVENLRHYVRDFDWWEPKYLGHAVQHFSADYNVLSAGVVLSNGSLSRLFAEIGGKSACDAGGKLWNNEDMYLGKYLKKLGVGVEDTRDFEHRGRFHGYNLNTLLSPGAIFKNTNYFKKAMFPIEKGFKCCSRELITIDTSDADHALLTQFLLYSIHLNKSALPKKKIPETEQPPWVKSLREIGFMGPTDNITAQQYYDIWAKHIPPDELSRKFAKVVAP